MGLFGNSFGVSERLGMSEFIQELDEAAAKKLVNVYRQQPTKLKLCTEITSLPEAQSLAVLRVASLLILSQLSLAFPKSDSGLTKRDLVTRQEGVVVMASKLPDALFIHALMLMMIIQDENYFKNHPELSAIGHEIFQSYQSGKSIYSEYFDSHFR